MEKQIIKSKISELKAIFSEDEKLSKELHKWIDIEKGCCKKNGYERCIECKFNNKCSVVENCIKYRALIDEKEATSVSIIMDLYPYIKTIKKNEYVKCINKGIKLINRFSPETRMKNNNSSMCICDNCVTCKNNAECLAYKTSLPKFVFGFFLYEKMKYLIAEYPDVIENI